MRPNGLKLATMVCCLLAMAGCRDAQERAETTAADTDRVDAPLDPASTPAVPGAVPAPVSANPQAGTATDEERDALGVLNAINDHEISAANLAVAKGVTGAVAEYAQLMIREHTDNRDKTSAFGPDPENPDAVAQREKGEASLRELDGKSGADFPKAYVDAMARDHSEALATLDEKLIPKATSPAVKEHLTVTRSHVEHHLERAKALQGP